MCDQASDLWQQLELASELESDLRDTVDWGRKWLVDFNAGKTQLVSFDRSNNTGAIDVKMEGSVLEEKSSFKMLWLTFSSKLDWSPYIISIAKNASKKIRALIHPEVALYLYKSTIRPSMEFCCHVWVGAPSCYLDLLDKLQKWICRTVGPSIANSLEPLVHRRNAASLSNKVMTRTIEHQQESIKGKWESSGATEHCLKCHSQFSWLQPKTLSREARYKSRKIRESLEIKRSKCDSSKLNINRDDGNFVKTNTWTPLLRNINDLESALRNQRSQCNADMTSN